MRRSLLIAVVFGMLLSGGAALGVAAHGGSGEEELSVEPSDVTAGQTVVLAGSNLEPDSDRVIVLAGGDLTVAFGTVTTDADGMFSEQLTIPDHLPSGAYELRAIGDETLTTPLAITAASGMANASPGADTQNETVVSRERSPLEVAIIVGVVALAALLGGWLVWRAERFRGVPNA